MNEQIRPSLSSSVMVSAAARRWLRLSQIPADQSAERGIMLMRSGSSGSAAMVRKLHECLYEDTISSDAVTSSWLSSNRSLMPIVSSPEMLNPSRSLRSLNDRTASSGHPIIASTLFLIWSGMEMPKSLNRSLQS